MFGRPNITGQVSGYKEKGFAQDPVGAFYQISTGGSYDSTGMGNVVNILGFSAARESSVFGRAEGVQPASLSLLPCLKF